MMSLVKNVFTRVLCSIDLKRLQEIEISANSRVLSQNKCLCQRSWTSFWFQCSTSNVGSEFGSCKISKRGYTRSQNGPGMFSSFMNHEFISWHSQLVCNLHTIFPNIVFESLFFSDPEMLEVGNGGMAFAEYSSHFSIWTLMNVSVHEDSTNFVCTWVILITEYNSL